MSESAIPTVRFDSFAVDHSSRSFSYGGFIKCVIATRPDQVVDAVREVETAVRAGLHAAGYISYEAGAAINPELPQRTLEELPLVWFAIFRERNQTTPLQQIGTTCRIDLQPLSQQPYAMALAAIHQAIAAGETYQVNYTVRQEFSYNGDPLALYGQLCHNQKTDYCSYLDIGSHQVVSVSPELFFSLKDGIITMQPMKGTAPRLPRGDLDRQQVLRLQQSEKERAENLMIVDMVRNDLSRIAEPGSVAVPALFEVKSYATLHQMTSTVTARVRKGAGLTDILAALFPCASITGAPKRRTMEIISQLEDSPRGVYCGAIGYLAPGGEASFSVAIRTAVLDAAAKTGVLGLGSGITWDSDPQEEFAECLTKGEFIRQNRENFGLIETLRHDSHGYLLLERHLQRLADSAAYFGFTCCRTSIRAALEQLAATLSGVHKVRLVLAEDGSYSLEAEALAEPACREIAPIALSDIRIDPADPLRYHKTTRRQLYEDERTRHPGCYDVIFLNQQGAVTEGCFNTIVIRRDGQLLTPAIACGLLPGVLREELLELGAVNEAVMTIEDVIAAEKIWLVNSVRGWRECSLETMRS